MKNLRQLAVWMDYSTAVMMDYHDEVIDETQISYYFNEEDEFEELNNGKKTIRHNRQHRKATYYKRLGAFIANYTNVLLFGPSEAKYKLCKLISKDYLAHEENLVVRTVDKMEINKIHTYVKEHFDQ
ncbi:MAG: hypothetical protein ACOYOT_12400 [Bacteroidales bacterium]